MSSSEPPANGERPPEGPASGDSPERHDATESPEPSANGEQNRLLSERAAADRLAAELNWDEDEWAEEEAPEPQTPAAVSDAPSIETRETAPPDDDDEWDDDEDFVPSAAMADAEAASAQPTESQPADVQPVARPRVKPPPKPRKAATPADQPSGESASQGAPEQAAEQVTPAEEAPSPSVVVRPVVQAGVRESEPDDDGWAESPAEVPAAEPEAAAAAQGDTLPAQPPSDVAEPPSDVAEPPSDVAEQPAEAERAAPAKEQEAEQPSPEQEVAPAKESVRPTHHRPERYSPGALIDTKYRLVDMLEDGAAGMVWVAQHLALGLKVSVKLIPLEAKGATAQVTERMHREASIAAQLGHPAIGRVYDFGITEAGDPYVVSERLEGETLAEALELEPQMPATRAVHLMLPIVDALAVAHDKGVVHRDVRPESIYLARDAKGQLQPKLLDFGLARLFDSDLEAADEGDRLTTPEYMAPEQARGDKGDDASADVWSVCVIIYRLVSGRVPYVGNTVQTLLESIRKPPEPLVDEGQEEDKLWLVLERGLNPDPEQRWKSMRRLGQALARWLLSQGVTEDVCGTRLASTWLGADDSQPRAAAPEAAPPSGPAEQPPVQERQAPAVRPESDAPPEPAAGAAAAGAPTAAVADDFEAPYAARRSKSPRIAVAVILLALLGVGLFVVLGMEEEESTELGDSSATERLAASAAPAWASAPDAAADAESSDAEAEEEEEADARVAPLRRRPAYRSRQWPPARRQQPIRRKSKLSKSKRRDWGF